MEDREKVIKGLQCCSVKGMNTCELQGCPYYPQKYEWNDCVSIITKGALELLKEQEELKAKLLRNIADNQLANSPTDTMDATSHTYYDGVWHGLQMAYEIVENDAN